MTGFIDLLTEKHAWSERQILNRAEQEIRRTVRLEQELIINRKLQGVIQGVYTLNATELVDVGAFQAAMLAAQARKHQTEIDNELLKDVLAYEQAQRDVVETTLLLNGREAVAEVPEVVDPETGVVIQEYVPGIEGVAPLPETVDSVDAEGEPTTVPNPVRVSAQAKFDEASLVISEASEEVTGLAALRIEGA